MEARENKLAIGTVQFGTNYGIANKTGKVSTKEVDSILDFAWQRGVDTLDTAIVYGESETILGSIGITNWKVISKIPAVPIGCNNITEWVKKSVVSSLNRLNVKMLYGVLLHSSSELLKEYGRELYQSLLNLKQDGLIHKIGISIYDPSELDFLYNDFDFDIIQAPLNILDRRLIDSGWLNKLEMMNIEVHVRSIFLQGLLLMKPEDRPDYFNTWDPVWSKLDRWMADNAVSPLLACISVALNIPQISRVVVGVDNLSHMKEICQAFSLKLINPPAYLACSDINLINPYLWQIK